MARQAARKSRGPETAARKGRAQTAPRRLPPAQMQSVNPATGDTLGSFPMLTQAEIETRLQRAADAFQEHRRMPFAERAQLMRRAADILGEEEETFARLMTLEMGKLLGAAREELRKCAWACRHYAEHAEALLAIEMVETGPQRTFVRFQPLGPVLAVMPWNFPFWQVFRFAAPALMAGNVALLKHASNVPQCALAIEDVFSAAGFAPGVFQTLLVGSHQVPAILDDDRVVAATVTGSEAAGAAVAARAGERIKKTVLELGGSDPFIVMPSADMDETARMAVSARTINNGQSCIASKRFIVHADVAGEFERRLVSGMKDLRVGDPLDASTQLGPLATPDIVAGLDRQVSDSVKAGARVLTGGQRLNRPGNFYAPTVITDVPPDSPAYSEELFGPVAIVFPVSDREEALAIANDSKFGLGASVWTRDAEDRDFFVDGLETGMVYVNAMVASDPRLPFGGVKRSGYGRELSVYGLREFVNVKTVWIREAPGEHRSGAE